MTTFIQQVTYVVDGSSTEVTEEVTASTPTAAKNFIQNRDGTSIQVVKKLNYYSTSILTLFIIMSLFDTNNRTASVTFYRNDMGLITVDVPATIMIVQRELSENSMVMLTLKE